MAPTNKDSGATRMAVAPMFQAVQNPELDTLGLVAILDFLKKRVRYLRFLAQNNKADGVNVFCSPDQFSRSSYVDYNSCLLVSSLPSLFYTMSSHPDIYI
jgi:hypothetical protein